MINRKINDLLQTSRASSSLRLDALSQNGTPSWSGPATPVGMIVSSTPDHEHLEPPILNLITELESKLNHLSGQVSTFQEDNLVQTVSDIVDLNQKLRLKTDELAHHARLGSQMVQEQSHSDQLDNLLKDLLRKLISYRKELSALPKLLTAKCTDVSPGINVADALQYALKLAKFTKAPASMANAFHQLHPNNFVWPAEDALRRGMLAASSLQPDEIINAEIGEPVPSLADTEHTKNIDGNGDKPQGVPPSPSPPPPPQPTLAQATNQNTLTHEPQQALDLDLFDEDEFSD